MLKKPSWLKVKAPQSKSYFATQALIKQLNLNTVCQEAACPNIGECWSQKHATIMIMGDICTRACRFCNVKTGKPLALDPHEPERVGQALQELGLNHVVLTSVDRDDLEDGGALHFAQTINAIRAYCSKTTIEILTPDFQRKNNALPIIFKAKPDVFNHNLETVPRLYQQVRPGAKYFHSLNILHKAKEYDPHIFTKSGIMVGLGETKEEVVQVMDDLRAAQVDFLTIGQYLQPSKNHYPLKEFITPELFDIYKKLAYGKGFLMVSSSALTRSSYHASADFQKMQQARQRYLQKNHYASA